MHLEETVITDYVDGTLNADERIGVERHLEQCAECRRLVDDFTEIRRLAGSLEFREPPARAWTRLERAIRLETLHATESGSAKAAPSAAGITRIRTWMTFAAAAAVLVLATVAGLRYVMTDKTRPANVAATPTAGSNQAQAAATAVEAELRAAEEHYDKAIRGLEQIANAEQGALDPNTAATLQKNLAVIDQAISESRAAVVSQPTSEPARESLLESFRTKLALLQDTVALINEMRKGNEAGSGRAASTLKPRGN